MQKERGERRDVERVRERKQKTTKRMKKKGRCEGEKEERERVEGKNGRSVHR